MKKPWSVLLVLAATWTLAGCGSPEASTAPKPEVSSPTSSITCSSPMPRDFAYSSDQDGLRQLAAQIGSPAGSPTTFDDVDADELGMLIERGFVDPAGDTNGSPTMWEFHRFLCDHPTARAVGFVAGSLPGDDQAVASLETVYADTIDADLRADAQRFCRTTPERTLVGHLECFWD